MAEFLLSMGAANEVDFSFLVHVLRCRMYNIAEMILFDNNALAEGICLILGYSNEAQ